MNGREAYTHTEGVPHARERLGNDVRHAHTATSKQEMAVNHISQADILTTARAEETVAELGGVEECRRGMFRR
jgi:hypothetical protein